jgi:hypothetical protein
MNLPLTSTAATALQNEHQSLIGQPHHSAGPDNIIECVCAAPYEEIAKLIFVYSYEQLKDVAEALSYYPYDSFDVIIISRSRSTRKLHYENLREYLENPAKNLI